MTVIPNKRLCVYMHSADGKIFYVGQGSLSGHMNELVGRRGDMPKTLESKTLASWPNQMALIPKKPDTSKLPVAHVYQGLNFFND